MTLAAKGKSRDATALMTAEELLHLGDDFHGELRRGKLITMSPAGSQHGFIAWTIGFQIGKFAEKENLGNIYIAETGFVLSRKPDTVCAPDLAFVVTARIPTGGDTSGFFEGAPDLAVEVMSPSNTHVEMRDKVAEYLKAGTRLVWIVNPSAKTVTVHDASKQDAAVLGVTDTLNGAEVLPGFTLTVGAIFK